MANPMDTAPAPTPEAPAPAAGPSAAATARRGDRRHQPTPMFSRYAFLGGRRRHGRRDGERQNQFVDQHGPRLLLASLVVVALNILDAWFTIYFLSYGGTEANPLVDMVLQMGLFPFIALKSVGIGVCVMFLCLAKNFRIARWGMAVVILGYSALLGWHFYLLSFVH